MFDYDINIVKIHEIYKQKSDKLCSHEDYLHGCKICRPTAFGSYLTRLKTSVSNSS